MPTTSVGGVAATSIPVTVPSSAVGATLSATAAVETLGGTCATCAVAHTVGPAVTTPPPPAPGTIGSECQVGVQGKARVGRRLSATLRGCPSPVVITSYQWYAGGKPIRGAHGATYQVKRSKLGKRISVRVTISAPGLRRRGAGQPADPEGALTLYQPGGVATFLV